MSSLQPQQPQQQPVGPALVYPNNVNKQPSSSHHSNGSFGTVFIVLAVIIVISAIACFLGRLCNRRHNSSKPHKQPRNNFRPNKEAGPVGGGGGGDHHMEFLRAPSFRAGPKVAGIEFGFDRQNPNGNSSSRGEERGYMNHHRDKPHHNGNGEMDHHMKGEMKQHPGDEHHRVKPHHNGNGEMDHHMKGEMKQHPGDEHHRVKPHHNGNGEMGHHMKGEMKQHPGGEHHRDKPHHNGKGKMGHHMKGEMGDPRASG